MRDVWATDTTVSKPEPTPTDQVRITFGGFAFTAGGMVFDLNEAEVEEAFLPTFAPEGWRG